MAMVCTRVTEWIENKVSKPVEDWEERTEQQCKKRHWYDPRSWFCWLVRLLVLVIRWVIITVLTAVITILCHLVMDLLSILWNTLKFLGNLLKALVTWDKCTLQAAIGNFIDAFVRAAGLLGDVIIRPITDRVQTFRLRRHVGSEIDKRFQPDLAEAIKKNLNVDSGVFGYRLTVTLHRMFVDSETRTAQSGNLPNLVFLHNNPAFLHNNRPINLYELAGFEHEPCDIFSKEGWRRSLPRTAKKTYLGGGGGLIDSDPPEITRDELTEYIDSKGTKGPPFQILAMSTAMQNSRIEAAERMGRQLGLLLTFDVKLREVTDPQFLYLKNTAIIPDPPVDCRTKPKSQADYLICELGRHPTKNFCCCDSAFQPTTITASLDGMRHDLCAPVAVGIFGYPTTEHSGWTYNSIGTTGHGGFTPPGTDLHASLASGVSFRAQIPDEVRQYVLIHELGHYFGLTHTQGESKLTASGFDRIMVSGEGSVVTVKAGGNFFLHGGPRFIYVEAKEVWEFILTNFPTECLAPPIIL
jgi:hypothetical protein